MTLSNEATIGLIGLVIMCAPLVAFIYRLAKRARRTEYHGLQPAPDLYGSRAHSCAQLGHHLILSPRASIPQTQEPSPSGMCDVELEMGFKLVTVCGGVISTPCSV